MAPIRLAMQYFPVSRTMGYELWITHHVTMVTESKLLFYLVTRFLPNSFAIGCEKSLR